MVWLSLAFHVHGIRGSGITCLDERERIIDKATFGRSQSSQSMKNLQEELRGGWGGFDHAAAGPITMCQHLLQHLRPLPLHTFASSLFLLSEKTCTWLRKGTWCSK